MIYQPTKYLLLAGFIAILTSSFGCTNVTETPPDYVISTPRIPQSPVASTTPIPTSDDAIASPTEITQPNIANNSSTRDVSVKDSIPLANLTPQQILSSAFFEPGSLTKSPSPSRGGILKIASSFDIPTLDPRQLASGGTMVLANFVYEGFVRYDQSIERDPIAPAILPALAYKWDFSNEGKELTLKLNSGIHWGNIENPSELGPEVTASDYLYTLSSYKDNSSLNKFYETLESIEVQNRYTLKLTFSRSSFWIISFFASPMGIQFNPFLAEMGNLSDSMIGPGPFILDSYESKSHATLLRNPHHYRKDYWGRSLPYLGSVQFIYAADRDTRLALIRTAQVQIAELALTPKEIDTELSKHPNLNVSLEIPSGIQNTIAFQLDNLNWATRDTRRAITLVTDGKGMAETIFEGFGMPSDKFEWWYWSDVLPSWEDNLFEAYGEYNNQTNIKKAQSLWEAEGMDNLTIKLNYYPYTDAFKDIVAAVQHDWAQLGITVQPTPLTYPEYVVALSQRTSVDAILATQRSAPNIGSAAYTRVHSQGIGNREGINNPKVDSLVMQLSSQPWENIHQSTLRQLRQHLNDEVYWVSLPSVAFISGTMFHKTVHGIPNGNQSSFRTFFQGKVLAEAWMD